MSSNDYIFDALGKLLKSDEFIGGIISLLEQFDQYEDRKAEKHSDKQLLQSAYTLYKQGRLSKADFLDVCSKLCPEKPIKGYQDREVESLLTEIENRQR
jgi:hypothetical protein